MMQSPSLASFCKFNCLHIDLLQRSAIQIQMVPLRKHACSNVLKILPPKNEKNQIKNSDIFHISAQNIDCGYSLEPPQ